LVARACAWGFGVHDTPPPLDMMNVPPVCED
jgi:hypothetical protein